jgi:hypothetical protein
MSLAEIARSVKVEPKTEGGATVLVSQGKGHYSVRFDPVAWTMLTKEMGQGELKEIAVHLHVRFWLDHLIRDWDFVTRGDVMITEAQMKELLS